MGAGSQSPPFPGVLGNPSMYNCVIVLTQSSALAKQGAFSWAVTAPNQHPAGQLGSGSTPLNKQCSPSLGLRSQGLEADSCFRNPRPRDLGGEESNIPTHQRTFISKWQAPGPGTHIPEGPGRSVDGQVA